MVGPPSDIKKSFHVFPPPIAARRLFSIITHTSGAVVIRQSRWLAPNPGEECGSLNLDVFSSAMDVPRGEIVTAEGWRQKHTRHRPCQHRIYRIYPPKKWKTLFLMVVLTLSLYYLRQRARPKESILYMFPIC